MKEEVPQGMKRCSRKDKCCALGGPVQLVGNYTLNRALKDGLSCVCRHCIKANTNTSKMKEYRRSYNSKNRAYRDDLGKKWRSKIEVRCRLTLGTSKRTAKKYGYTPCTASYEELLLAFSGKCHICGAKEQDSSQKLHMDHSHVTGQFRGWLCFSCNHALGNVKDSPETLRSLIQYLERAKECLNLPVAMLQKNAPTPVADAPLFSST